VVKIALETLVQREFICMTTFRRLGILNKGLVLGLNLVSL